MMNGHGKGDVCTHTVAINKQTTNKHMKKGLDTVVGEGERGERGMTLTNKNKQQ
jgi:hypothetical protein